MADDVLTVPRRSLVALCGPAGAGKSTFAAEVVRRNHLAPTAVVSSDACRLMLCDDPRAVAPEQWATLQPGTFHLFLSIVDLRMGLDRPVIADTVNLHAQVREGLLDRARARGYPAVLVVFDMPLDTCLLQNQQRDEARRLPEGQIRAQRQTLDGLMPRLAAEGWDQFVILDERRRTALLELDR